MKQVFGAGLLAAFAFVLVGCPADAVVPVDTGPASDAACHVDSDCDDGAFCNGEETCDPSSEDADARGCVEASSPCTGAGTVCDEASDRCGDCATMGDLDDDGERSTECGGVDCDDDDPARHPGATEVCDTMDRDEDCDPTTYGYRDSDGDDAPDARCCNVDSEGEDHCGSDCDDMRAGVSPTATETCNAVDDDCDTRTDEGVLHTYFPDVDDDLHGDPDGTPVMGCMPPTHYAEVADDCNDVDPGVHPGTAEQCDVAMVDENCDDVINPPDLCMCSNGDSRACTESGVCAAGTTLCVDGVWAPCSIAPTGEICDGLDNDCNGTVDEMLRVTCYADLDNDAYAAASAVATPTCPAASGREAVGGCPVSTTNVAPLGSSVDCDDTNSMRRPGAIELCTLPASAVDDDCDGATDEMVAVTCYADDDNDTYAAAAAVAMPHCRNDSRPTFGYCPTGHTSREPTDTTTIDCRPVDGNVNPGMSEVCDGASPAVDENCDGTANPPSLCMCTGTMTRSCPLSGVCAMGTQTCSGGMWLACTVSPVTEVCDGRDEDCDGAVDDGVTITCYRDNDNDQYPPSTATATPLCRDATRMTMFGGCPLNYTNRTPAMGADCNDSQNALNPGAAEACDRVDSNCSSGGGVATDEDFDNDGQAAIGAACTGGTLPRTDCNDTNAAIFVGATEICDRVNSDCSPGGALALDEDADGDGRTLVGHMCTSGYPHTDCLDTNNLVYGGAATYRTTPYCTNGATPTQCSPPFTAGWTCTNCFAGYVRATWDYDCSGGEDVRPVGACLAGCGIGTCHSGPMTTGSSCGDTTTFRNCGCSGMFCSTLASTTETVGCR